MLCIWQEKIAFFIPFTFDALALYDFLMTSGGQAVVEGIGRRNGPFISLKNGSFKEPLLSVHFVWAWGTSCPRAVFLLQEREGATHYETANG